MGTDISAAIMVKDVIDEVRHYSKETEQFDDITCVALFYREEEKEEMTKI